MPSGPIAKAAGAMKCMLAWRQVLPRRTLHLYTPAKGYLVICFDLLVYEVDGGSGPVLPDHPRYRTLVFR